MNVNAFYVPIHALSMKFSIEIFVAVRDAQIVMKLLIKLVLMEKFFHWRLVHVFQDAILPVIFQNDWMLMPVLVSVHLAYSLQEQSVPHL